MYINNSFVYSLYAQTYFYQKTGHNNFHSSDLLSPWLVNSFGFEQQIEDK